MKDIRLIWRSIRIGMKGLRHAYRIDKSIRMEVRYGLPIYFLLGWMLFPFTPLELVLFVFSYLLIIIIELINTAFETMLNKIHPEDHELIGKSKDIASSAVLVALLFAGLVNLVLLYTHVFAHSAFSLGGAIV